jgi:hypothetical protein
MQQIREACPWEQVPRYLLRDRDAIYGREFAALTQDMGMEEVVTALRAPWQNPYVERLVGSIRRECLDHVIAGPGSCVCDSSGRRTPSPIPASSCLVNPKRPTPTLDLLT